jgi:hypothetical protein
MLVIREHQQALAQFELWRYDGDAIEHALIRSGARGDKARAMEEKGSRVVWYVEALSHLDLMTKYYAHMNWGDYHSDWPDLDAVPFFYTYAMETLAALPKNIAALREYKIYGDGSCKPAIAGPMPRILIQNRAVFAVDIHVFGEFGGHGERPLNESALIAEAQQLIQQTKSHLFRRRHCISLICPKTIAERMLWVSKDRGV